MKWDAEFHAFQLLARLANVLMPDVRHYTAKQCKALHEYAALLAKDLTNGQYEFNEKRHK